MKSMERRLKKLESTLFLECSKCDTEPCICEKIYPAESSPKEEPKETFASKIAILQHKAKADRIETEMQTIKKHFVEGLADLKNYFEIVDYTVKYVEANVKKVSLLLEAPITSAFKKELAISFLDTVEPYTDQLIDFIVSKNFPKKKTKKLLK